MAGEASHRLYKRVSNPQLLRRPRENRLKGHRQGFTTTWRREMSAFLNRVVDLDESHQCPTSEVFLPGCTCTGYDLHTHGSQEARERQVGSVWIPPVSPLVRGDYSGLAHNAQGWSISSTQQPLAMLGTLAPSSDLLPNCRSPYRLRTLPRLAQGCTFYCESQLRVCFCR